MRIEIDGKPIDSVRVSVELEDGSGSEAILGGEEIARAMLAALGESMGSGLAATVPPRRRDRARVHLPAGRRIGVARRRMRLGPQQGAGHEGDARRDRAEGRRGEVPRRDPEGPSLVHARDGWGRRCAARARGRLIWRGADPRDLVHERYPLRARERARFL